MTASEVDRVPAPPTGTVTFFFSDIEGSTRMVEALGSGWAEVLERHRAALRTAFTNHGGVERGTEGDSFFVAFPDASEAVAAAVEGTRALASTAWPEDHPVRVRMGLHTGEGRVIDGDYVGLDVHRAARIAAAGSGGQVLISESTRILAERRLAPDLSLRDLGEHRLKDLPAPEHLYQVVIDGERADFPPLRSLARTVANLPAQLGTIIGREADVDAVQRLLEGGRLVTVTGPGGTGKTRLVQEVARSVARTDNSDVAYVPLDALTDAALIPIEILRALRLDIAAARDPLERLVEHLTRRPTMLVLDNLEQLDGAGLQLRSLLDRAPTLSILASSQASLYVAGEQAYPLGSLSLPVVGIGTPLKPEIAAASPAIRLFIDRARAVRPDFSLDATNVAAVVAICTHLDGLPLAIELAAAQVKLFSPPAILERITGRLDALTSRREDLPARQRTLRATVAWSYELLGDEDRRLFRRLAAFAGGARLAEIEAIGEVEPALSDTVGALETLVDRSLVRRLPATSDEGRFGMPETMRAYGRELLEAAGEAEDVTGRHAAIYHALAHEAEPNLYGPARRLWGGRLRDDQDNLRSALDELRNSGNLEVALDLAADLWRFWQQRGHLTEGGERLDDLLAAAAAPGAPKVSPFVWSRAEEAAGGIRYWTTTDRRKPRPFYERSLEHALESGDRRRVAWARYNLAFVFDFIPGPEMGDADIAHATALREDALAEFRALDDRRGIAESLWAMGGNALIMLDQPERSRQLLSEALPLLDELGDAYGHGWALNSLAMLAGLEGDLDRAEDLILRAADVFEGDTETAGEIVALMGIGSLFARRGDAIAAVRMAAAASAAAKAVGAEIPRIPPIFDPLDAAAASLAPEDLQREREVGVALGLKSMLATTLESWRARHRPGSGASCGP